VVPCDCLRAKTVFDTFLTVADVDHVQEVFFLWKK
jgi:hypothetical protein